MNLRPRQRQPFFGFTKAEVQKMEKLLNDSIEQSPGKDFFKNLAKVFSPYNTPTTLRQIKSWFEHNRQNNLLKETSVDASKKLPVVPETPTQNIVTDNPKLPEGEKGQDISKMEFEARFLSSGETEVHVRYLGFGADDDEWVNVKHDVRECSIALEHSECQKVKVGDLVVCYQESKDQARYFDAHVIDIQRRLHNIRGCRCLFLINYDHDNTQESVRLRRLCCRPNMLSRVDIS